MWAQQRQNPKESHVRCAWHQAAFTPYISGLLSSSGSKAANKGKKNNCVFWNHFWAQSQPSKLGTALLKFKKLEQYKK